MIEARHGDRASLARKVADRIAGSLRAALAVRPRATLVVPGGSTPGPVFDLLAAEALDWSRVSIVLGDERWVSTQHADSNEHQVRARLLQLHAATASIVSLYRPVARPSDALSEVTRSIDSLPKPFDVVMLGMGEDGHFASLFPGNTGITSGDSGKSPSVLAFDASVNGYARMSLSFPALLRTRLLLLVFQGDHKRSLLERGLLPGAADGLPVRALLQQQATPLEVYWAP